MRFVMQLEGWERRRWRSAVRSVLAPILAHPLSTPAARAPGRLGVPIPAGRGGRGGGCGRGGGEEAWAEAAGHGRRDHALAGDEHVRDAVEQDERAADE